MLDMNHPKVITSTPRAQTPNLQVVKNDFVPVNMDAQASPNRLNIHVSDKMLRFLGVAALATTLIGLGGLAKDRLADHTTKSMAKTPAEYKAAVHEEVATHDGIRISVGDNQTPVNLAKGAVDASGDHVNEQEVASFLQAQGINEGGRLAAGQVVEFPEGIQPTTTTTPDQG